MDDAPSTYPCVPAASTICAARFPMPWSGGTLLLVSLPVSKLGTGSWNMETRSTIFRSIGNTATSLADSLFSCSSGDPCSGFITSPVAVLLSTPMAICSPSQTTFDQSLESSASLLTTLALPSLENRCLFGETTLGSHGWSSVSDISDNLLFLRLNSRSGLIGMWKSRMAMSFDGDLLGENVPAQKGILRGDDELTPAELSDDAPASCTD